MAGLAIASRHSALPTLLGINPPLLVLCPSHPKLLNVAPHLTLEEQPYPLLLAVGWTLEPLLLYRTSRFWLSNLAPLLTLGDNLPSPLCRWLTLCLFSNSTSLPIGSSPYFGRNRILPSKRLVEPFFFIELYLSDCWDWILLTLGEIAPSPLSGWLNPSCFIELHLSTVQLRSSPYFGSNPALPSWELAPCSCASLPCASPVLCRVLAMNSSMSPRVIPVATSCHDSFATLPHASSVTTRFWRTSAEPQSSTAIISEPTPVRPEKSIVVGRYSSLLLSLLLSGILAIISTSAFSCTVFSSLIRFSFSSWFTLSTLATVVAVASFGCRSFGKKTPQLLLLEPFLQFPTPRSLQTQRTGHSWPILTACRYTPMGAPCNSLDYVCCRCHLSPQHEVGGLWQG